MTLRQRGTMNRNRLRFRSARPRGEIEQQPQRKEGGEDSDELRGREHARNQESAHRVAPPDLEDRACDRVEKHIEPEDLAVEVLAAVRPLEGEKDQKGIDRKVDLCRM